MLRFMTPATSGGESALLAAAAGDVAEVDRLVHRVLVAHRAAARRRRRAAVWPPSPRGGVGQDARGARDLDLSALVEVGELGVGDVLSCTVLTRRR